jgi:hypothetical protein
MSSIASSSAIASGTGDAEQLAERAGEGAVERGALPHHQRDAGELRDLRLRVLQEQRLDVEDRVRDRQHLQVPADHLEPSRERSVM